jgi:hypothetical protein
MRPIPPKLEVMDDAVAAIMRRKTPGERLRIAFGPWTYARDMVRASVRHQHPDHTEDEVRRAVARRMSHGAV